MQSPPRKQKVNTAPGSSKETPKKLTGKTVSTRKAHDEQEARQWTRRRVTISGPRKVDEDTEYKEMRKRLDEARCI